MKNLNSYLTILFLSFTIGLTASIDNVKLDTNATNLITIGSYLNSIDFEYDANTATLFTDFIIKENDELYTLDFMISEKGEVFILSKTFEEEYYILEHYSTKKMKTTTIPMASIYLNDSKSTQ